MQLETEMKKIGLSEEAQCQMRRMLSQKESNYIRLKRAKMDKAMFVKIKGSTIQHNELPNKKMRTNAEQC